MDAYLYERPQLKVEFRYTRNTGPYWDSVRDERRFRSKLGRAIPYQCITVFGVRQTYFERAFCAVTAYWRIIEVARNCSAELPAVFTYRMPELHDAQSGWWVIA